MLTGKDQLILVALQIPNDLGTVLSKVQDCANPVFHKRLQPIREKGVKIHCIDRKTLLLLILPKKKYFVLISRKNIPSIPSLLTIPANEETVC